MGTTQHRDREPQMTGCVSLSVLLQTKVKRVPSTKHEPTTEYDVAQNSRVRASRGFIGSIYQGVILVSMYLSHGHMSAVLWA